MRQAIKTFLWTVGLACSLQSAWAFSLLGPVANGGDAWQVTTIGYNPLTHGAAPPFFIDPLATGPKNLGEEYRRNTPVLYYAANANFLDYFGSNGVAAIDQSFAILNALTNVDLYSAGLTEFPLNSKSVNYSAQALFLYDLKSATLSLMTEQLGLADAVRYTWALHDRNLLAGATCPAEYYTVIQRNFDITASPLNQIQYSPYVDGELYSYFIYENCAAPAASPPDADALEIPNDPLFNNPPVASGNGEDPLLVGGFYTGLTRDDVAGLRYLLSTNNVNTESPATGALLQNTNFNLPQLLFTSNLTSLVSASQTSSLLQNTNDPAILQAMFPGLVIESVSNYFALVVTTNISIYQTNYIGGPVGSLSTVVTFSPVTNIQEFFTYTFGNVMIQSSNVNARATLQTITVAPQNGSPAGSPPVATTNTQNIVLTNVPSGDYYFIPAGTCGFNILYTIQTNVIGVTNNLVTVVNGNLSYSRNLITFFTNHVYVVAPCTFTPSPTALYQGIGRMQFVRADYDSELGQFFQPITNIYTMVSVTNSGPVTLTFQRVVTTPDFIFSAADLSSGPDALPLNDVFSRNINFNQGNIYPGLAGPGTINPSTIITFNKVGPVYLNLGPNFLTGPNNPSNLDQRDLDFLWGSFDGSTNDPVVYPNGTSIANLAAEVLIQISPASLPNGTNGVSYTVTLSATGAQSPDTWALASGSVLPPGLNLSSGGVISGIPAQSGASVVTIQMTDAANRTVAVNYSITIN